MELLKPADIEARSFATIEAELAARGVVLEGATAPVVKRVVHATADFDFAESLVFSPGAVQAGVRALRRGCTVVTDTTMVAAGVNKRVLGRFGGQVRTFVADADVAAEAKERGCTRSFVAMERAAALGEPCLFAIGNAPTALVRVHELAESGAMPLPALVVGVPVGFVNVVESKELACTGRAPFIVARGRKGGSPVAAAIVNALLYLAADGERE